MDRPLRIHRTAALTVLALLLYAAGSPPASACSTDSEALAALEELRDESGKLYRETTALETNLEDALARRAREASWDKAQTETFRRRLLEDPEYLALHRSREDGALLAADGLAKLVTAAATEHPAVICAELSKARFANQRLRTLLDLEYAWLNRKIWGN
jgi:hypothetical protein